MTPILIVFAIGIVLLAADVFVTSFVLAAAGGVAMLVGCALAYRDYGAFGAGAGLAAAAALLGGTVYLELFVLPRTRLGRGLVTHSVQHATSQPPIAPDGAVVGKDAEALTTLAPSGYVQVEGRRYEAFCQSGHAVRGARLRVVGADNFRLIVALQLARPSQEAS